MPSLALVVGLVMILNLFFLSFFLFPFMSRVQVYRVVGIGSLMCFIVASAGRANMLGISLSDFVKKFIEYFLKRVYRLTVGSQFF